MCIWGTIEGYSIWDIGASSEMIRDFGVSNFTLFISFFFHFNCVCEKGSFEGVICGGHIEGKM